MNEFARVVYGGCVAVSLLLVAAALHAWGAAEIRANFSEVAFLTCVATACLVLATKLFSWFGLNFRDDVVERKNTGALIALCGAAAGIALIYTGGSVGEGPSYLNNVFSAGLAATGFFVLWALLEFGGDVSVSITEERDVASGVRLCGFLVGIALVLGRAVAGAWHSESATVHDFINDGWFAVVLGAIAVPIEHFTRPNRHHPFRSWTMHGLFPAVFYVVAAIFWLWHLGPWEGMPR
jgi:uncharacterized membrane protein YjfL (UPF0719 family)